ncbi:MAG: LPS biosynthesis protein WbpP [Phycisphaerae bacterium]|nr:LPS biosynthesis protein WbpP [Phycisphaerae bacterium]
MTDLPALVTGGAGFIGSHLVDELVARGRRVTVLDDLSTGHRDNLARHAGRITFIEGGVEDLEACRRACIGMSEIFHLASRVSVVESVASPTLYREVVLGGTRNMLRAAEAAGARRLVLASSCSVYGDAAPPISEAASLDPQSPYAAMKAEAEEACRESSISTVCPRFFNVYGPRQRADSPYSGVIAIFARMAADSTSPTVFGDGLQTRDFIHVSDVVRGLRLAVESPNVGRGEPINFGTGTGTTVLELASLLGCPEPRFAPSRQGEVRHSAANPARGRELLEFESGVVLESGLATLG